MHLFEEENERIAIERIHKFAKIAEAMGLEIRIGFSGEVRYRIWRMKWFGLKKAELKNEFVYYDTAKFYIDSLRKNVIVKKKFID